MVCLLALAGVALAVLRHLETGIPFTPGQKKPVWLVEARVDFVADGVPVTASLSLPEAAPGFELYEEQAASPGYGFAITTDAGERRAEWTRREASGEQSLYYSAQFVEADTPEVGAPEAAVESLPVYWDEAQELAADQVLRRARETSSSPRSLARELIKLLNAPSPDQNTALLRAGDRNQAELLMLLIVPCATFERTK